MTMPKYRREIASRLFCCHDDLKPKTKARRLGRDKFVEALVTDGVRRSTAQRIANELPKDWYLKAGPRLRIAIKK